MCVLSLEDFRIEDYEVFQDGIWNPLTELLDSDTCAPEVKDTGALIVKSKAGGCIIPKGSWRLKPHGLARYEVRTGRGEMPHPRADEKFQSLGEVLLPLVKKLGISPRDLNTSKKESGLLTVSGPNNFSFSFAKGEYREV